MLEQLTFLSAAETRDTFFQRIGQLFPTRNFRYQAIERAYDYAEAAFRDIYRETGDRYFEHLRAVPLILIDYLCIQKYQLIIAGLLHDIVEDVPDWTITRVELEFGREVAVLVELATKPPLENFGGNRKKRDLFFHQRFRFAPRDFFLIKLPDRLHNLITLRACPPAKRRRKIRETRKYYLPYARECGILLPELEEALRNLEKGKKRAPSRKRGKKTKKAAD